MTGLAKTALYACKKWHAVDCSRFLPASLISRVRVVSLGQGEQISCEVFFNRMAATKRPLIHEDGGRQMGIWLHRHNNPNPSVWVSMILSASTCLVRHQCHIYTALEEQCLPEEIVLYRSLMLVNLNHRGSR